MDWNSLKYFLAIARNGSLAGAARELGVNHSTVFRRLNTLEEELKGSLFERLPQGYLLTPLGEAMQERVHAIADSIDELERSMAGKEIQPRGLVKITAPNNIVYRYLAPYLYRFQQSYPQIEIELLVSNQALNMSSRQADIAVRATERPPEYLVGRELTRFAWGVYAGAAYLAQHAAPSSVKELADHRLIGAAGAMRNLPAFLWQERYYKEQVFDRCDDLVAMSYLAEVGKGLALLPDDQKRPGIVRLFELEAGGHSPLWILTHPELKNVERIKLLMRFLTEQFAAEV